MDIIYAFSQMSDYARGAELAGAEEANAGMLSPGPVRKRDRSQISAETAASCSDSILGYLCWRYTRALKAIERLDGSACDQTADLNRSGTRLASFSEGITFKTEMVLRLLAAGARQHPVLRHWLWSVVAGLPEGPKCVAMALCVVQSHEMFLLNEWAHGASRINEFKGSDDIEAEKAGPATLMTEGGAWLSRVLMDLESSCQECFPVALSSSTRLTAGQPISPCANHLNNESSQAKSASFSIETFETTLFRALSPVAALRELPPQLAVYALLRSPSKRYRFVRSLLRASIDPSSGEEGGGRPDDAEAVDSGPLAWLPAAAYTWLLPLWGEEPPSPTGKTRKGPKLHCPPPPNGGVAWLCDTDALPTHYEDGLRERLTRPLGAGARARSKASGEAALGLAAVLLAEHLQQTSVALDRCCCCCCDDSGSANSGAFHQFTLQQENPSTTEKAEHSSEAAPPEGEVGGQSCSLFANGFTPLERALAMMQLDEELVCGSHGGSTKKPSTYNTLRGELIHECNSAWAALAATLAIGEGIPAQYVRMCLDPLDVSLRASSSGRDSTSLCTSLLVLRDYIKEHTSRSCMSLAGKNFIQPIIAGAVETPSNVQANSKSGGVLSNHPDGSLSGDSEGNGEGQFAYRVVFPLPIFDLRMEDIALYTSDFSFPGLSGKEARWENGPPAEGMQIAPERAPDGASPRRNSLPRGLSSDFSWGSRCVSSSMATVVAVALRHPRVELFQLECVWQLLYYRHGSDVAAFHTHKSSPTTYQMHVPAEGKGGSGAYRRQRDDRHRNEFHSDDLRIGKERARSTSAERVQHERAEELGRRMQRIFDCFAYSALVGLSPCIAWQQKNNDERGLEGNICLDGRSRKCKRSTVLAQMTELQVTSSTTLNHVHSAQQKTYSATSPLVSKKIDLNNATKGARRVLKLGLGGRETRSDSETLPALQVPFFQSRMSPFHAKENSLDAAEGTTHEVNDGGLAKREKEWSVNMKTVLQFVAKVSTPLETTCLSASLQSIFDTLLTPLEALWTTHITGDISNLGFSSENSGSRVRRCLPLSSDALFSSKSSLSVQTPLSAPCSTKRYDDTCGHSDGANRTEGALQGQERCQLLSLITPGYVKQFQDVMNTFFQTSSLELHPAFFPKTGSFNADSLHFKSAALVVQRALKATVGSILCFCIYRFLLHCYLQASRVFEYEAALCIGKERRPLEGADILQSSRITSVKQGDSRHCKPLATSDGESLKEVYNSFHKKLRLILQHATMTLKPILRIYVKTCLPENRSESEAFHNFYACFRRDIEGGKNERKGSGMFYGPVSCILLPMVLKAYEAALRPMIHGVGVYISPELLELKDMLRQYGLISQNLNEEAV